MIENGSPKNFGSKIKNTFVTYKDGLYWFSLTCLWALILPMFARWFIPSFNYSFWTFLSEGDIVLFSMVITSSLVIDNFLFEEAFATVLHKKFPDNFQRGLVIHISPMLMIVFCLITCLRCQMEKAHSDTFALTIAMEIVLFIAVAAYAAFIKQMSLAKDKSKTDKFETGKKAPVADQT